MIEELKGDHQQLADLELSQHLQALATVFHILPEKPKKGHPFHQATGFTPISQEMRYRLKIGKRNHFSQFRQALTQPAWQPLLLLEF